MSNIIKNSIVVGLIMSLLTYNIVFSQVKSNLNVGVFNKHNDSEIIYLLDDEGNLIKLNNEHEDFIPDNLPKLSSIYVNDNNYVALTKDNKVITSYNSFIPRENNIIKIDKVFLLTNSGRVMSLNSKLSKKMREFKNVKDIYALSEEVVLIQEENDTFSIVREEKEDIVITKGLKDINDIIVYNEDLILFIMKNGSVEGIGYEYENLLPIVSQIKNGKKFINQEDNLYVLTYDNKAIPIIEKNYKAPTEYLNNVSNIVIDKFASGKNVLYKAYFVTPEGKLYYHIQSNNDISDYSENKMKYFNTFENVETVYESGYLTIVLHKDGSITIPYDTDHELNGLTSVKNIVLKNQSYVVYLEDGQVITSLNNFLLNKKYNKKLNNEDLNLYEYLNNLYLNILNKKIDEGEYEVTKYSIGNNKESLESYIKDICLDRKFLVLDYSDKELINILYSTILNSNPSLDEYNHMEFIISSAKEKDKSKLTIVKELVEYILENPIFSKITKDII